MSRFQNFLGLFIYPTIITAASAIAAAVMSSVFGAWLSADHISNLQLIIALILAVILAALAQLLNWNTRPTSSQPDNPNADKIDHAEPLYTASLISSLIAVICWVMYSDGGTLPPVWALVIALGIALGFAFTEWPSERRELFTGLTTWLLSKLAQDERLVVADIPRLYVTETYSIFTRNLINEQTISEILRHVLHHFAPYVEYDEFGKTIRLHQTSQPPHTSSLNHRSW